MKQSLTLIIAVYKARRYLELVFAALRRQSMLDFEVIIADDGSGPEIAELIESSLPYFAFPVKHLWQPDAGFRKNVMLNRSIEASQTDYLVFIDGDCVPHHEFIRDHWEHRKLNALLSGRRVMYSKEFSERLRLEDITSGRFEKLSLRLLLDGLMGRSTFIEEGVRIENPFLRRWLRQNDVRIVGCNFSLEKSLLEKINGFNEDYHSPGLGEDSDVAHRLALIGVRVVNLRHLGILYHLYHPSTTVGEESKRLYEQTVASMSPICRNGLRKL